LTRRNLFGLALSGFLWIPEPGKPRARTRWIDVIPSVIQTDNVDLAERSGAHVLFANIAADPTWGPYAQRLSVIETRDLAARIAGRGLHVITYIEGVGDCMLYAIALVRDAQGRWEAFSDDPLTPRPVRTHWCWLDRGLPRGNVFRWAGIHASAQNDDYVRSAFTLPSRGVPLPRYPDGRLATGTVAGRPSPLNAAIWDACASKDITGRIRPIFAPVVGLQPGEEPPDDLKEGLLPVVAGSEDIEGAQVPQGTTVWCGAISVHKDLSAPFWRDYARASAREIARAGLDGVWCDNWSPWDNFGYPPIKHAFGDWSVHRLNEYLRSEAPKHTVIDAHIEADGRADIRAALRMRSKTHGVANPDDIADPGWSDARWLDDPLWRLIKCGRQVHARRDLRAVYQALHAGAREGGCRDFAVCGNDIPFYGLGWARDAWTDMVHTEITPGWHMGAGTRGIMLPPMGKMAVVYRAARAHQKGSFCTAWYYLDKPHQKKQGLARVLLSEAFAHGALLLCDPGQDRVAGSVETHGWLNSFVRAHGSDFQDRSELADVALAFSPDCQLYELAPGGFPDMDHQPHVFGHWGWGTALLDVHVPYIVLPDWKLELRWLRRFRTLIMPDVVCLSDSAIKAIIGWVRSGGRLVATGSLGMRRGVEGAFEKRDREPLPAVGVPSRDGWSTTALGRGTVVHHPDPIGMHYYLNADERAANLRTFAQAIGGSALVREVSAPSTVELALWSQGNGQVLAVDLANVNIALDADRVAPAPPVEIKLRVPWRGGTSAAVLSPDPGVMATCSGTR
jgi:hypothetical protein